MTAGVDMVHLWTDQYRVKDLSGFTHNTGNVPYGKVPEVWGYSVQGQPMFGKSVFVNRGADSEHPATIDISSKGLFIQFNPSTLLHPYHLTTDLTAQTEAVKDYLHNMTIDTCLDSMKLSRVDLTKQAQMEKPFFEFSPALSAIHAKRMKNVGYGVEGFKIGNKSRGLTLYDKGLQMSSKKGIVIPEKNLLRAEATFRKKAIGNDNTGLGLGTYRDLQSVDPEHLNDRYRRFMQKDVFRIGEARQMTIDYGVEQDVLRYFLHEEKQPRKAISNYVMSRGIDIILIDFGGLDNFCHLLRNEGVGQKTIQRIKAWLREQIQMKGMIDQIRQDSTTTAADLETLIKTFAA